jgi:hypothetical protein
MHPMQLAAREPGPGALTNVLVLQPHPDIRPRAAVRQTKAVDVFHPK